MSFKSPFGFGRASLLITRRTMKRARQLVKGCPLYRRELLVISPTDARRKLTSSRISSPDPQRWQFQLQIERARDDNKVISLPMLVYLYSPLQVLNTKLNLWKLKLSWDWSFNETEFVDHSKQGIVTITKLILGKHLNHIKRCTTPMGFKQIKHDLLQPDSQHTRKWPHSLMRFEKRHVLRAMPLKVQRLSQYDHKFAFIDMIYLACRRTDDFASYLEARTVQNLIAKHCEPHNFLVAHPIIFAEFFVRYRRDYSLSPNKREGNWLISTYKVLQLNVLNHHPILQDNGGITNLYRTVPPLSHISSRS